MVCKDTAAVPFQLLVDLITEAYDVLPVLLPVSRMGGFICPERDTHTSRPTVNKQGTMQRLSPL